MITISASSLEYVRCAVKSTLNGAPYNPTNDAVQFSFTTGPSAPGTWNTGSWETDSVAGTQYIARCLVGPSGTITLTPGTYTIWVKITDNPEVPVKQPGQLKVY